MQSRADLIVGVEDVRAPVRGGFVHTRAVQPLRQGKAAFVRAVLQLHTVVQAVATVVRTKGAVDHEDLGLAPGDAI
eukprot:COSAG01_NODE_7221_length_3299_cov_5.049375_2_plen_76_part_00